MKLSYTAKDLKPSPTLAVSAAAKELRRQGIEILDLSLGEPDFATPTPIKEAAKRALDEGWTKYTPVPGLMELREKISEFFKNKRGLNYDPSEIMVSTGAKQCLYNVILSLIGQGDEVIMPSPYWVSYPTQVALAGGESVFVPSSIQEDFQVDPDKIKEAITPYTRMILLNSPNNPTGAVYEEERLEAIAQIAYDNDIWILSDEMYDELVYEGTKARSIVNIFPKIKERAIVINGFSKAYAMTGWRLGFVAAPKKIIDTAIAIQGATTSGATAFVQRAALTALDLDPDIIETMRATFEKRLQLLRKLLLQIPDLHVPSPKGAFYLMPDFSAYFGKKTSDGKTINNGFDLAHFLLNEAKVALVPGEAFGVVGPLRISYAASEQTLEKAALQIKEALALLT